MKFFLAGFLILSFHSCYTPPESSPTNTFYERLLSTEKDRAESIITELKDKKAEIDTWITACTTRTERNCEELTDLQANMNTFNRLYTEINQKHETEFTPLAKDLIARAEDLDAGEEASKTSEGDLSDQQKENLKKLQSHFQELFDKQAEALSQATEIKRILSEAKPQTQENPATPNTQYCDYVGRCHPPS